VIAAPVVTTTYTVTDVECEVSATVRIVVTDTEINIPNVITPNGDGINDGILIRAAGYTSYSLAIYDRWGNKKWSANAPTEWRGLDMNNNELSTGTYIYTLEIKRADGVTINRNGVINLLR
jgi:gliding motility-associated-like protein